MRTVPDWWIQTSWWASGIFATGAVWYFLSIREYSLSIAAGVFAVLFAIVAILLHKKKDTLQSNAAAPPQVPVEKDKLVTSQWWEASDLRKEYISRGLPDFRWSNVDRVAERQQQGYEVVYLNDPVVNIQFRIVNKSGQVLIARSEERGQRHLL